MEPHYNQDLGTIKITMLYPGKNHRNLTSWDQQNYLKILKMALLYLWGGGGGVGGKEVTLYKQLLWEIYRYPET